MAEDTPKCVRAAILWCPVEFGSGSQGRVGDHEGRLSTVWGLVDNEDLAVGAYLCIDPGEAGDLLAQDVESGHRVGGVVDHEKPARIETNELVTHPRYTRRS